MVRFQSTGRAHHRPFTPARITSTQGGPHLHTWHVWASPMPTSFEKLDQTFTLKVTSPNRYILPMIIQCQKCQETYEFPENYDVAECPFCSTLNSSPKAVKPKKERHTKWIGEFMGWMILAAAIGGLLFVFISVFFGPTKAQKIFIDTFCLLLQK